VSGFVVVCLSNGNAPMPEFEDENEAWQWLEERCDGDEASMAEWLVVPADAITGCETVGDLFEAAGFKRVYNGGEK